MWVLTFALFTNLLPITALADAEGGDCGICPPSECECVPCGPDCECALCDPDGAMGFALTASAAGVPDTSWYNTADANFTITTAEQLAGLAQIVNDTDGLHADEFFEGKTINQAANIDLSAFGEAAAAWNSGRGWVPIGSAATTSFTGTFDGHGHKITGLFINDPTLEFAGIFGHIGVPGAATVTATVRRTGVYGEVSASSSAGLLVGFAENSRIEQSYSQGKVTLRGTSNNAGGLVGGIINRSIIENCWSSADVTHAGTSGNRRWVGGVIGFVGQTSTARFLYATGRVSGFNSVGGVAGGNNQGDWTQAATIQNIIALNPSITRNGTEGDGRTVGRWNVSNNALAGILAWDGIIGIGGGLMWSGGAANNRAGLDKNAAQIREPAFWTTAGGFTANWDTNIWTIEYGSLPGLFGKSNGGAATAHKPHPIS